MAIVWSNAFDGTPGTNVTVANSGAHGDPIAGLRDNPPANSVRYGDRSFMGQASMRLGAPTGSPHGNVWLHYPDGNEYSLSFYLYLPEGGWFRMRDANVVVEFYLATGSQSYIGDSHPVPDQVRDAVFDRWVRIEISTTNTRSEYRFYWSDPHTTGAPDYVYNHARDGGIIDGIFTQGAGDSGATTPYLDQVRIGEGEWLGPWPADDHTITAAASLPLAGGAHVTGTLDPIVWENTFDGDPGTAITVENSGAHGDPVTSVDGATYSAEWAAAGTASALLGSGDGETNGQISVGGAPAADWSVRWYSWVPATGWQEVTGFAGAWTTLAMIDGDLGDYSILGQDVTDQAPNLVDRPIRVEAAQVGGTLTVRVWWTSPHSTGPHDLQVQATNTDPLTDLQVRGGGFGTPPSHVDEVAVGIGGWIGPAVPDDVIVAAATLPLTGGATIFRHARTGAGGTLPLSGGATIVRHALMGAAGTLGVSAPEAAIRRQGRFTAGSTLPLAGRAEIRSQFRATFPPMITTELMLDGEWVDVSSDVLVRDPVQITRGRADEAATADPSTCALTLNNRHGKYSPHNPLSPYYGQLGKNTPLRVRVGPLPDTPDLDLADTFDRALGSGWGQATTGQTWEGTVGASVSGGAGHQRVHSRGAAGARYQVTDAPHDMDVSVSVRISHAPQGWAGHAVFAGLSPRWQDADNRIMASVGFRVDTGSTQGLRITTDLVSVTDGVLTQLRLADTVAGLAYQVGEWLRVRMLAVGPEIRLRIWPEGTPEPSHWHAQVHHTGGPSQPRLGLRSSAGDQVDLDSLPITMSYRDLKVRPVIPDNLGAVSRFAGEVSEWPARWDTSDTDVWVPVTASGTLRRLGQGGKPLRSVLRRSLEASYPLAYWPLEDGSRTQAATPAAPGTGPLRVAGMRFAEDTSLPTSGPLPTLSAAASMSAPTLVSRDTGAWEVDMLYRLDLPDDGFGGPQTFLQIQGTELDVTLSVDSEEPSGRPILRRWVTNANGDLVSQAYTYIDAAPGFFGEWRRFSVTARTADVGWVQMRLDWYTPESVGIGAGFTFSAYPGRVTGVTTRFGPELEGMGVGHLTVWGAIYTDAYYWSLRGFDRESARQRISRVAAGAGVPVQITGAASETLGVEQPGTYLEVIGAAQEADFGAPGETRHQLGLTYRGRDLLYNQTPALVLDYGAGEISPPMEPVDDDQGLRNEVEVTRQDGASFQVEDVTGPLGVDRVGRYDTAITLNLGDDEQAEQHAGWRLHLGTVDELRWPTIRLNLANPRLSARVEDVLDLDVGDRVRILNPPPWAQAAHLDLIVQGYTETLNSFTWEIELTCTPASPWAVGEVATTNPGPDAPVRADTAGSELTFDAGVDDTHLAVDTTHGPPWVTNTHDPDSFPFHIRVGGEVMQVTMVIGDGTTPGLPQTMIVDRAINGVHKPHRSGAPVRLAHPMIVAL